MVAHRKRLLQPVVMPPSSLLVANLAKRRMTENTKATREPVAIDALPLSSSDEEDGGDDDNDDKGSRNRNPEPEDISDSDDDGTRGNIRPSTFNRMPSAASARLASSASATSGRGSLSSLRRKPGLMIAKERREPEASRNSSAGYDSNGSTGSRADRNGANGADSTNGAGERRGTKRPRAKEQGPGSNGGKKGTAATAVTSFSSIANHSNPFGQGRGFAPRATYGRVNSNVSARSGASSAKSSQDLATFKKPAFADDSSDLSEPDAADKKKPTAKRNANGSMGKGRATGSNSPPAKFIPPHMSSEEDEPRTVQASPPKKFQFSKHFQSLDDDEAKETKPAEATPKAKFKHKKVPKMSSDDDDEKASESKATKEKTTKGGTAELLKRRRKVRLGKEGDVDKGTNINATAKTKKKFSLIMGQKEEDDEDDDDNENKNENDEYVQEKEAATQLPVFRMPEFSNGGAGGHDDGGGSLLDISFLDQEDDDHGHNSGSNDTTIPKGSAICPLCKTLLDADMLRALLPGHHLLERADRYNGGRIELSLLMFDEKVMFCAGHKQRASRHAWTARGYPAIDWVALPARLEKHYAHVKSVLLGTTPSPFRDNWGPSTGRTTGAAGATGTAGSTATPTPSVPGYYGLRGLQVLSDAITHRLSDVLRRRAVEDPLVAARGMAQYVQGVLVPEMAVQLIREDMGGGPGARRTISVEDGRRILCDSAAIGEDVMDEERDVVLEDESERGSDDDERGYASGHSDFEI